MSQHDLNIANQTHAAFRADLNNALEALGSSQFGSSEPPTTYAGMFWYESDGSKPLKVRNSSNSGWYTLAELNGSNPLFKGGIQAPNGTASVPAYGFSDEVSLGIYRAGSGHMVLRSSSTAGIAIKSSTVELLASPNIVLDNIGTNKTTVASTGWSNQMMRRLYPQGTVYQNATVNTNPVNLLGFGTWELISSTGGIYTWKRTDSE